MSKLAPALTSKAGKEQTTPTKKGTKNMIKILKQSHPYFVIQDNTIIDQFCVMVKTEAGFSQQISPWYFRQGNAIRKYNKILQSKTMEILERKTL